MQEPDRRARRDVLHRRVRQQRIIMLVVAVGCASFLLFFFLVIPALRADRLDGLSSAPVISPTPGASGVELSPSSSPSAGVETTATPSPVPDPTGEPVASVPPRPPIVEKPIHFGPERREQTAEYSRKRYGDQSTVLVPKAVVLHYTAGDTWQEAWNLFESNAPNQSGIPNDLPGVVAHFIIDKDGTIYRLIPLDLRGRHTIGLNDVAIGIEFVELGSGGSSAAVHNIFQRKAQIDAGLALVRWLQYRFDIPTKDVIGHGTANESHFFTDLEGFKNDHSDWGPADVHLFQKRLRELDAAAEPESVRP